MAEYKPFADIDEDDDDLSALFGGEEKQASTDETEKSKPKTLGEILELLPETERKIVRDSFTNLAEEVANKTSTPSSSETDVVNKLVAALQGNKTQASIPDPADEAEGDVMSLLKEMGLEDESKSKKFVKAVNALADRRVKNEVTPYVNYISKRFAREEKAELSRRYPESKGNPSLDSVSKEMHETLTRFPSMELTEAYEFVNRGKLALADGSDVKEKRGSTSGRPTAEDVIRKFGLSTDKPASTTSDNVEKNGGAKSIRDAMAMSAKQLGYKI